ncbi:MAG: hypothetical protein J3Q66DRAFT_358348 [Benniella sp.]|nr:MAG: hypothetical protein J3Q66DRAFT_358348 [Benniella sp.]
MEDVTPEEFKIKEPVAELTIEEEVQSLAIEMADTVSTQSLKPGVVSQKIHWRHGGHHINLTGTFDNWTQTVTLVWDGDSFSGVVDLDRTQPNQFKFVVDGSWMCSSDYATEHDGHGNINNVLPPLA